MDYFSFFVGKSQPVLAGKLNHRMSTGYETECLQAGAEKIQTAAAEKLWIASWRSQ